MGGRCEGVRIEEAKARERRGDGRTDPSSPLRPTAGGSASRVPMGMTTTCGPDSVSHVTSVKARWKRKAPHSHGGLSPKHLNTVTR